jgi:hypothetical protein
MSVAEVEPISPELVLVCPELREWAISTLPDFTWRSFVEQARVRTVPEPAEVPLRVLVGEAASHVRVWATYALAAVMATIAAVLAMTLIANATR